jgi:hypothetical protein
MKLPVSIRGNHVSNGITDYPIDVRHDFFVSELEAMSPDCFPPFLIEHSTR